MTVYRYNSAYTLRIRPVPVYYGALLPAFFSATATAPWLRSRPPPPRYHASQSYRRNLSVIDGILNVCAMAPAYAVRVRPTGGFWEEKGRAQAWKRKDHARLRGRWDVTTDAGADNDNGRHRFFGRAGYAAHGDSPAFPHVCSLCCLYRALLFS